MITITEAQIAKLQPLTMTPNNAVEYLDQLETLVYGVDKSAYEFMVSGTIPTFSSWSENCCYAERNETKRDPATPGGKTLMEAQINSRDSLSSDSASASTASGTTGASSSVAAGGASIAMCDRKFADIPNPFLTKKCIVRNDCVKDVVGMELNFSNLLAKIAAVMKQSFSPKVKDKLWMYDIFIAAYKNGRIDLMFEIISNIMLTGNKISNTPKIYSVNINTQWNKLKGFKQSDAQSMTDYITTYNLQLNLLRTLGFNITSCDRDAEIGVVFILSLNARYGRLIRQAIEDGIINEKTTFNAAILRAKEWCDTLDEIDNAVQTLPHLHMNTFADHSIVTNAHSAVNTKSYTSSKPSSLSSASGSGGASITHSSKNSTFCQLCGMNTSHDLPHCPLLSDDLKALAARTQADKKAYMSNVKKGNHKG